MRSLLLRRNAHTTTTATVIDIGVPMAMRAKPRPLVLSAR
jgi:hypothetical protein